MPFFSFKFKKRKSGFTVPKQYPFPISSSKSADKSGPSETDQLSTLCTQNEPSQTVGCNSEVGGSNTDVVDSNNYTNIPIKNYSATLSKNYRSPLTTDSKFTYPAPESCATSSGCSSTSDSPKSLSSDGNSQPGEQQCSGSAGSSTGDAETTVILRDVHLPQTTNFPTGYKDARELFSENDSGPSENSGQENIDSVDFGNCKDNETTVGVTSIPECSSMSSLSQLESDDDFGMYQRLTIVNRKKSKLEHVETTTKAPVETTTSRRSKMQYDTIELESDIKYEPIYSEIRKFRKNKSPSAKTSLRSQTAKTSQSQDFVFAKPPTPPKTKSFDRATVHKASTGPWSASNLLTSDSTSIPCLSSTLDPWDMKVPTTPGIGGTNIPSTPSWSSGRCVPKTNPYFTVSKTMGTRWAELANHPSYTTTPNKHYPKEINTVCASEPRCAKSHLENSSCAVPRTLNFAAAANERILASSNNDLYRDFSQSSSVTETTPKARPLDYFFNSNITTVKPVVAPAITPMVASKSPRTPIKYRGIHGDNQHRRAITKHSSTDRFATLGYRSKHRLLQQQAASHDQLAFSAPRSSYYPKNMIAFQRTQTLDRAGGHKVLRQMNYPSMYPGNDQLPSPSVPFPNPSDLNFDESLLSNPYCTVSKRQAAQWLHPHAVYGPEGLYRCSGGSADYLAMPRDQVNGKVLSGSSIRSLDSRMTCSSDEELYGDDDAESGTSYGGISRRCRSKTGYDSGRSSRSSATSVHRLLQGMKQLGIRGELSLSIILSSNLLTITIGEARNLCSRASVGAYNAYVRISLIPDEEKRTQFKTNVIASNNPVFNQDVTIEILPEDYRKKLLVSVWHRDLIEERSYLLGCMAFSIRSFIKTDKNLDGWYFLLGANVGRRKHLSVDKVTMLTYYDSVDSGLNSRYTTSKLKSKGNPIWL